MLQKCKTPILLKPQTNSVEYRIGKQKILMHNFKQRVSKQTHKIGPDLKIQSKVNKYNTSTIN